MTPSKELPQPRHWIPRTPLLPKVLSLYNIFNQYVLRRNEYYAIILSVTAAVWEMLVTPSMMHVLKMMLLYALTRWLARLDILTGGMRKQC